MPLHDWTDDSGWDGFHLLWISHLFHAIKPQLPGEFRAYVGSVPALSVAVPERPDVSVRHWVEEPQLAATTADANGADAGLWEPDIEVATITLDPQQALYIIYRGRLVAAIELISPRNKDRPSARAYYLSRYLGYLREGAHFLLVDAHPRPVDFSFADALAKELHIAQSPTRPPLAVGYRVGGPASAGGRLVAIWRRPLVVGQPLPTIPLTLTGQASVLVNLEETYMQAAADVYLS